MSSWASMAQAFRQPVCHRLSSLHHWSVPHVHTSRAFSPSGWSPDPQYKAMQVAHWTWWWQSLVAWHCRSVWSLPCHSAADAGGLALSMAKSHWHGALCSAHKGNSLFFLFLLKNIDCGYSLELPHWGSSKKYQNLCFEQKYEKISEYMFWAEIWKNFRIFYLKIFIVWW